MGEISGGPEIVERGARSIHRVVGNNSSFGGNSLVETIGLQGATRVDQLAVSWPTSGTTQVFRDVAADQSIVITEGSESFQAGPPVPVRSR